MNAIKQLAQVLLIMCLSLGCTSKKANKDPLPDHTFKMGAVSSYHGIDLSHHNRITDFEELKRWQFIYHKASEGGKYKDPTFRPRMKKLTKLGVQVGGYHFFTTTCSAKKQFENFRATGAFGCELVPVIDFEINKGHWSRDKVIRELQIFIDLCQSNYNIKPIIYSGRGFILKYNLYQFGCPIWLGAIGERAIIKCDIHQSALIRTPGIVGDVDYNECDTLFINYTYHKYRDFD